MVTPRGFAARQFRALRARVCRDALHLDGSARFARDGWQALGFASRLPPFLFSYF